MTDVSHKSELKRILNRVLRGTVLIVFSLVTLVLFPIYLFYNAPAPSTMYAEGGFLALTDNLQNESNHVYRLGGEWEFYPNELYTYDDFKQGSTSEPYLVQHPHTWKDDEHMDVVGYATYRMRVEVPGDFTEIGLYTRYQFSAFHSYIDDLLLNQGGVVDKDFSKYEPSYISDIGYGHNEASDTDTKVMDIIIHVQNDIHIRGGLTRNIYLGPSDDIRYLRVVLLFFNGLLSGALLLLMIYFILVYLNARNKSEHFDYALVTLAALFLSLTNAGESLLYAITGGSSIITAELLLRLEYIALPIGAFFANYHLIKRYFAHRPRIFTGIHIVVAAIIVFFMTTPPLLFTRINVPNIIIAVSLFLLPLIFSVIETTKLKNFDSLIALLSFACVFLGMILYVMGAFPWNSIDLFSLCILLHCVLQMVLFLKRYSETERDLTVLTATLEQRIVQRTEELTAMKERAESATEAKSNFLATMSHEIRTPMNAIIGMSDLMRTDNLDMVQQRYFSDIRKTSKALFQIINDILDFSKIEAGKLTLTPVHFNLFGLYDNICSLQIFTASTRDINFRHNYAADVPQVVYGDEIRYRQIITNIVSNALKYTKKGYVLFEVNKAHLKEADYLRFYIEDTGIGIKEEDLSRLFHSFEQLDSQSNRKIVGTGLGLSITKLLVTMMGGWIEVESIYGQGSSFTIYLPLIEGDPDQVEQAEVFDTVFASEDVRVLVVDDNSINLTVASGFLAVHNITADVAHSGREAINILRSQAYDIVFMDHMMPEMDGVETTRIIRGLDNPWCGAMPIVALTANAVVGAREFFLNLGFNDFLSKPIEALQMNRILGTWIPEHKMRLGEYQAEQTRQEDDSNGIVLVQLGEIKELNVPLALQQLTNNSDVFVRILKQYCQEAPGFIADLRQNLVDGKLQEFSVSAHAMKGIFANLGATELSQQALALESAGREGDEAFCLEHTDAFLEKMNLLREALQGTDLFESKQIVKTVIDKDALRGCLRALLEACNNGMSEKVDELVDYLRTFTYASNIDTLLEKIYICAENFDYIEASELISIYLDTGILDNN